MLPCGVGSMLLVEKEIGGEAREVLLSEGGEGGDVGGRAYVSVEATVAQDVVCLGVVDEGMCLELSEGEAVDVYLVECLRGGHVVYGFFGEVTYHEQFLWR